MPTPSTKIPLPADGIGSFDWWKGQADWSADIRKDLLEGWRRNAKAYCDKLKPSRPGAIRVNIEFEKTEQKRHQLFYRLPAIKLRAHPRTSRDAQPELPTLPLVGGLNGSPTEPPARDLKKAIAIFREVLSMLVGPEHANMKPTVDEIVFDVLCPAGIGFIKMGYERHTDGQVLVPTGAMIPDPAFAQPGSVLGLGVQAPQIPEKKPGPNVIYENYYGERISPALGLVPAEFRGSDYSGKAPWLGQDFKITPEQATAREWKIPDSKKATSSGDADTQDDRIMELDRKGTSTGQLNCREIFYYAHLVDPSVKHPKKIRRLVLVEGVEAPVVHEDCKDQQWDTRGRLIGGIETLPIKVLTLRYVSDLAYPPSDCTITQQAARELSEFRSGQVEHRRKAVPRVAINVDMIASEKIKKLVQDGKHYGDIPVNGNPDKLASAIGQPQYPNDNWLSDQRIKGDIDRDWSLGAGANPSENSGTTATEVASIERAAGNRMAGEREKVVGQFYMECVRTLAQLVQLYADQEDYVEIVGEDGAKALEAWNKDTIAGKFIFEAVPDSSMPPDAQGDRDLALNRYNLLANDPFANREQLYRDTVAAYDGDPDRLTKVPEPPQPPPQEQPRVNLSIKGEDLNPAMPQYANIVALLAALQIQMPQQGAPAQEPTGPADVVDRERLRLAESDESDQRAGGLVGAI